MPDFAESFAKLVNAFGLPYGRDLAGMVKTYQEGLQDIPEEDFEACVNRWVRREGKFPTVAQLRQEWEAVKRDRYKFWVQSARFFLPDDSQKPFRQSVEEFQGRVFRA